MVRSINESLRFGLPPRQLEAGEVMGSRGVHLPHFNM
jgi:hypothetical protein